VSESSIKQVLSDWSSVRTRKLNIWLALIIATVSIAVGSSHAQDTVIDNADDNRDMLAYVSDEGRLILYDPHDRTEKTLLEDVQDFTMSQDGHIAFTRPNDPDMYIVDLPTPEIAPIIISPILGQRLYPLSWSPDGGYLAMESYRDRLVRTLYVWDGEAVINIMPNNGLDKPRAFYIDWDNDGRLVFTIVHGFSNLDIPSEVYIWDGNTTFNVIQNPEGYDGRATWSNDGQLMFESRRGDEANFYVWDGVSMKNQSPDADTFIRVPIEEDSYYINPRWTFDGFIAFTVYIDFLIFRRKRIALWDLGNQEVARYIPISSDNSWSRLSEDSQIVLSSHLASGYPSFYLDIANTEGHILFSSEVGEYSWSSSGYLAYCRRNDDRGWILSIWDGQETWDIADVSYKPAQWQYMGNTFSCNSG
jgi:WD40 repeat protein